MAEDIQNKENFEDDSNELFSIIRVPWKKSTDDVWSGFKKQMIPRKKVIHLMPVARKWQFAAAAVLIISLGIGVFMHSYTIGSKTLAGNHITTELPDGSIIYLNAESEIHYKPYWWWFKRSIDLKGEAFFEVKKGKEFSVESVNGTTRVLGTTFSIFSRGGQYEVICATGKVMVKAKGTEHSIILLPSQKAKLQENGLLEIEKNVNTENTKSWLTNMLIFTSASFTRVIKEIEKQYNVEIILPEDLSLEYTGSFEKLESVEEVLHMVCRPFNLKVEKKSDNQFIILR
ncbi:MAG: FecR family protein [Bacteroidales bacterium]|nr:FecR family protein [Bacteroidales bacterium]